MNIKSKEIGDVIIINVSGRMDSTFSKEDVIDFFKILYDNKKYNFIMNLEEVDYMSSNGIRIIINAKNILDKENKKIKLCGLRESVKHVADIVELSTIVETFDTEDEALKSFSS